MFGIFKYTHTLRTFFHLNIRIDLVVKKFPFFPNKNYHIYCKLLDVEFFFLNLDLSKSKSKRIISELSNIMYYNYNITNISR